VPPSLPDEPRIETDDIPPLPPLRRELPLAESPTASLPSALAASRPEGYRPDLARRMPDLATPTNPPPRRAPATPMLPTAVSPPKPLESMSDGKRLTVCREICLSGEITACEVLVVEGKVEASLSDSRAIEIAGRYEGNLTVRDRLLVRASGKVSGSIRYRRLEVELGGEITGDMQVLNRPGSGQSTDDAAAQ